MKSIIFVVVFCFFIGLAYIDHSKYGIIYNPLEPKLNLLEDSDEKQLFRCSMLRIWWWLNYNLPPHTLMFCQTKLI